MSEDKQVTIYDVAKACGLSKGTVDRVVHCRGRVSRESREKVEKAIAELGYKPNAFATMLGSRTRHKVACMMPEWHHGDYWDKVHDGFMNAASEISTLGIMTEFFSYADGDKGSFDSACRDVLASKPDGIILRPLYPDDLSMDFIHNLNDSGIPYSYVDNLIGTDNGYLSYHGVDFAKSGRLGAYLMTEGIPDFKSILIVRIHRGNAENSDPTYMRLNSFVSSLKEMRPGTSIHIIKIRPDDLADAYSALDRFFKDNPGVSNVAMLSSRVHIFAKYMEDRGMKGLRVLGYDDTDANLKYLDDGGVTYLITRHINLQSSACLKSMSEYLIMGRVPEKDNYMHMDILTRLNKDNYL